MDVKLCCVFNSCKVKSYFSLKSKTPSFLSGNVVYKYTCQRDADRSYIGETARYLIERAGEHLPYRCGNKRMRLKREFTF